ncbi:MAG: TorF family putative porin [Gammaproteobacteria bacterium]|nr:TorF family putative porin [Gammaproteobacteria bacterium]
MILHKYLPILLPIAIFNISSASADTTVNLNLTSNYVTNGISQTNDKAALQLGIDYEHSSGAYIGTWASNVETGYELDFNAGYIYRISDTLGFDIGGTRFTYSDSDFDEDSSEIYLGCICLVGLLFYAEGEYQGFDYVNYDFRTEFEIQKDLAIGAHYGVLEIKELDVKFYDYYFSLRKTYSQYEVSLTYWYSEFSDDAKTFLNFTKKFNF